MYKQYYYKGEAAYDKMCTIFSPRLPNSNDMASVDEKDEKNDEGSDANEVVLENAKVVQVVHEQPPTDQCNIIVLSDDDEAHDGQITSNMIIEISDDDNDKGDGKVKQGEVIYIKDEDVELPTVRVKVENKSSNNSPVAIFELPTPKASPYLMPGDGFNGKKRPRNHDLGGASTTAKKLHFG